MNNTNNQKKPFFKKALSSLYEVENFLNQYTTFSDAVSIFKVLKHRNNKIKIKY